MNIQITSDNHRKGSILVLVLILLAVLILAGLALLKVSEGRLIETVRIKSLESASAAAEAGYENAVFWMSQQPDMLESLESASQSVSLSFPQSSADYKITFANFIGARPVFKVEANGYHGIYQKTIQAYLVQAISGWELAKCQIPSTPTKTEAAYFVTGEIINMPMHINDLKDNPDNADIYISGSPQFKEHISMGESRYTSGKKDKYASLMKLFPKGISFSQPASRIIDSATISAKVQRFYDSTNLTYRLTPQIVQNLPKDSAGKTGFYSNISDVPAVHLKFYVKDGHGYLRIYNDCTVATYLRGGSDNNTWDYRINPNSGTPYAKYGIYGCHFAPSTYTDVQIDDPDMPIYVRQKFGNIESKPGAQIYIDGNVVIGCSQEDIAILGADINKVKGQISIVSTGIIWLTNVLTIDGSRQEDGMPSMDNPNIIGLISQALIRLADPGMTDNNLLYNSSFFDVSTVTGYVPIGLSGGAKLYNRKLPKTVVVEAAITLGGGGWGPENLYRHGGFPGRKNFDSQNDILILRGTITEPLIGLTASDKNGFLEQDHYDKRLMSGILPGNIWLKGKYLLVPGGWNESTTLKSN
jgi:hypothetical protein